jgi:hypothetical protein
MAMARLVFLPEIFLVSTVTQDPQPPIRRPVRLILANKLKDSR